MVVCFVARSSEEYVVAIPTYALIKELAQSVSQHSGQAVSSLPTLRMHTLFKK